MLALLQRYRSVISYLFFGGCTTLLNIIVYTLCTRFLLMDTVPATVMAWIVAVLFAYITNRIWVFGSNVKGIAGIVRELAAFFACRIATGALDIAIMFVCVEKLRFHDIIMKVISNIIVIILNYVASKIIVFKPGKPQ